MPIARASTSSELIPLSVPVLGGREWEYLKECLDTGWVSSAGPFVERFEREIARYVGVTQAVATVSGTAALHIALRVAGVEEGDEVLVPALTFIAPVNAIRYCGAHPVFIDADPATWQMDVKHLERVLERCEIRPDAPDPSTVSTKTCWNTRTGRRVRAILPVHLLCLACDMEAIRALARRHHLRVVEDAAEGMGVRYRGRHVGCWGDVGCLSFNGNKIMTSGGGGMVVANNNPAMAEQARYLTTQAKDDELEYIHRAIGYNYRLTSLQAAVGLAQLEQLDGFIERKRRIAQAYEAGLRGLDGITLMPKPDGIEPTYWLYTILLREGTKVPQRQAFIAWLRDAGIEARPLWHPIHRLPPYEGCQAEDIACADDLYALGVSLPSGAGLSDADLDRC